MDSQSRDYKFLFYLGGITLAGLLLRLNHLGTESITADEVSALLRLQFNSLGEMLEGGVRPDGHPAFTQVLLWFWIKLFGNSEFAIRLPFVLMGTASIWLAGQTARRWFGVACALATASALAFLQFPIIYSQLARPYAAGLFFTMLAAYFVSRFGEEKKVNWKHIVGFAIAGAGAAYSHYFSLYTTLLLGVAGLFLVSKQNRQVYVLSALCAALLFIPHLSFTISQLGIGGVGGPGGWLGPPTPEFFGAHFFYVFNSSVGILIAVLSFASIGLLFNSRRTNKLQFAMFLLWIIPLLTGYYYSIYVNPVLQHSVLLFSFPFLFMLLFSWLPYDEKSVWSYRYSMIILLPLVWYITVHKPFRLTDHFGRLKEIVEVYENAENAYGNEKVDVMFNVDDPYFINYYRKCKRKINVSDDAYLGFDGYELLQLRKAVQNSTADYFVYGWSTRDSYPAALDIIAEKFPCLKEKHEWFNSAVYVFQKHASTEAECLSDSIFYSSVFDFQTLSEKRTNSTYGTWTGSPNFIEKRSELNGSPFVPSDRFAIMHLISLGSTHQFTPVFNTSVGSVLHNPDNEIVLECVIKLENPRSEAVLVVEYIRDGKQLLWTGSSSTKQLDTTGTNWQIMHFAQRPAIDLHPTDSIRAYVFTPNLVPLYVGSIRFTTREGHRGIYGIRPDYE